MSLPRPSLLTRGSLLCQKCAKLELHHLLDESVRQEVESFLPDCVADLRRHRYGGRRDFADEKFKPQVHVHTEPTEHVYDTLAGSVGSDLIDSAPLKPP